MKKDLTGMKFDKLFVLSENPEPYISPSGVPTRRWNCRCDCGKEVTVLQNYLTSTTCRKSCGCSRKEIKRPKNYKTCVICGKSFACPPSSKTVTCSKECNVAHHRNLQTGVHYKWSEEQKQKLRDNPSENLTMWRKAHMLSEKSGRFETNINAKHWILKSPDNQIYEFDNLSLFISDHKNWFPNTISARTVFSAIANNKTTATQYKGWQVIGTGANQSRKENNS